MTMWDFPLFPRQASSIAPRVDRLYLVLVGVWLFFTLMICVLVLYFAIKYRRSSTADRTRAATHNLPLEVAWIAIPLMIALGLFVWGTNEFFLLYSPPGDASEVSVVAKQWMWYLQHPEGKREINELHVPLNRPIRLNMISQDVIHSFYVPDFRVKQDVLPGRYTSAWFEPTRVGRYHLFCAEYCGTNHSAMIGWITVMEPSDFQRWLDEGNVAATMATTGAQLFRQFGCSGCHSPNSTVRAPLLDGVYGRPVPLQSGDVVIADDRYIRDSIMMPKSQIVAGYEPVMPTFASQIKEDELLQIIAYIKSLGNDGRAAR